MTAITKQKMGTHAGVPYSVQITKIDGLYYPRIVILCEPALVVDACIIFDMLSFFYMYKPNNQNPFNIANDCAVGFIDGLTTEEGKQRLLSGEAEKQLGVQFLEKKLLDHRAVLVEYKKLRTNLLPITEEFKERVEQSAVQVKWLQHLIKNHYMSERYAGRISTEY
jgi:hypothetical protein